MRIIGGVATFYCLVLAVLVAVEPATPPPVSAEPADGPHGELLGRALEIYRAKTGIRFEGLLGRSEAPDHHIRRAVEAHEEIDSVLARAERGPWEEDRAHLEEQMEELGSSVDSLRHTLPHHEEWVGQVRLQLWLAFGLGIVGGVLVLAGFRVPGAGLLALGGLAPLLYGVVSQPFPAEPLLFSAPLLVAAGSVFLPGGDEEPPEDEEPSQEEEAGEEDATG